MKEASAECYPAASRHVFRQIRRRERSTMAENGEYLGISPPLAIEAPKPKDLELNELLMQELKAQNNFESSEETKKR